MREGVQIQLNYMLYSAFVPTNGYRCQIPACEGSNFSFGDFDPDLLFPSFDNTSTDYDPHNPNYCRFYNPIKIGSDNSTCSHINFSKTEVSLNFFNYSINSTFILRLLSVSQGTCFLMKILK